MSDANRFKLAVWRAARALELSRAVENPGALLRVRTIGGEATLRFASGFEFTFSRKTLRSAERLLRLAYYGAVLTHAGASSPLAFTVRPDEDLIETPEGLRFRLATLEPFIFAETFVYDAHFRRFSYRDHVVIDVGGFVGDTALYFAQRGAQVVVYEPDPQNFTALTENLKLNPRWAGQIVAKREAVGVDGMVGFHAGQEGGSGVYAEGGVPLPIRSVSLATLLEENAVASPLLLKVDSKGTEFELVRQEAIERFPIVAMEYSADLRGRGVEELLDSLRSRGFAELRLYKHHWSYFDIRRHGMIHAERYRP